MATLHFLDQSLVLAFTIPPDAGSPAFLILIRRTELVPEDFQRLAEIPFVEYGKQRGNREERGCHQKEFFVFHKNLNDALG